MLVGSCYRSVRTTKNKNKSNGMGSAASGQGRPRTCVVVVVVVVVVRGQRREACLKEAREAREDDARPDGERERESKPIV